jgi:cytochrome c-type biogenesis protein CcmH
MTAFIAAAAALSVLVLGLMLRPLLFRKQTAVPRRTLAGVALAVPVAAAALYGVLGNANALNPNAAASADPQIEKMVATLAAKLEKNPGDQKGWVMLARSYKATGRPIDAERAYEKAGDLINGDAQELANYADVIATNANGHFSDKAMKLIEKALKADPNNAMALWLAGTAVYEGGDKLRAVQIWQKLLAMLPPDSEDARDLRGAIVQAGGTVPVVAAMPGVAAADANASVTGTVELDPKLKAAPGDVVMVIARLPGQRMPLAVMRVPATSFPLPFTLDDSLAMTPQARISSATEVEVEARVSKSGQAIVQQGDMLSPVQTVKVGAKGVNLLVTSVRM